MLPGGQEHRLERQLELDQPDRPLANRERQLEVIERRGLQTDVLEPHHPAPHSDPQLLPGQVDDVLPQEALQQRSEEVLEHHPRDPGAGASPRVSAAPLPGPILSAWEAALPCCAATSAPRGTVFTTNQSPMRVL